MSRGAYDRPIPCRALPLDSAFGVSWYLAGADYSAADVLLVLTNTTAADPAGTRVELTDASSGYTVDMANQRMSFAPGVAWTAAHLAAGVWEGIWTVNGVHLLTFRFQASSPSGGNITP